MLDQFNNDVLSRGAASVLPKNLSNDWLSILEKTAEEFLDTNYDLQECRKPEDVADPILPICVAEIVKASDPEKLDMTTEEMLDKITIYALSVIMEAVHRESDIGMAHPTLDNILSWERIAQFKTQNPEFIDTLEKSCILKSPERSWFQKIKDHFNPNV